MWASFQTYLEQFRGRYRCWYWYAELRMMQKTGVSFEEDRWTDLWEVVRAGVAVRGAFDFGLKSFVRAFHEHGRTSSARTGWHQLPWRSPTTKHGMCR